MTREQLDTALLGSLADQLNTLNTIALILLAKLDINLVALEKFGDLTKKTNELHLFLHRVSETLTKEEEIDGEFTSGGIRSN